MDNVITRIIVRLNARQMTRVGNIEIREKRMLSNADFSWGQKYIYTYTLDLI